jgi:hypothetical protein
MFQRHMTKYGFASFLRHCTREIRVRPRMADLVTGAISTAVMKRVPSMQVCEARGFVAVFLAPPGKPWSFPAVSGRVKSFLGSAPFNINYQESDF